VLDSGRLGVRGTRDTDLTPLLPVRRLNGAVESVVKGKVNWTMGIRVLEEVTLDDEGRSRTTGDRVRLDVLRRLLHRGRREVQSNSVLTGARED